MKLIVISNPINIPQEEESLIQLFEAGLSCFHVRKPGLSEKELLNYLAKIPPKFYKQMVIHSHYSLIKKYNFKGIHFPSRYIKEINNKELSQQIKTATSRGLTISTSAHSIDEVESLTPGFSYCFLSPVFNSISKEGYNSPFNRNELATYLKQRTKSKPKLIALGGINGETISVAKEMGFDGVAALGYLWNDLQGSSIEVVKRFEGLRSMSDTRPYLLSIAGFDPSAGAGVLADIKTFEANKVYGLGVCSALTFQNDKEFDAIKWITPEDIIKQIEVLARRFPIKYVKIGLIENLEILRSIAEYLHQISPDVKIVWDPILKASAGFEFHKTVDRTVLIDLCKYLYLITPNLEEIRQIFPEMSEEEGAKTLSEHCNILLKGGHSNGNKATDILFSKGDRKVFESEKTKNSKHGTGCVLASAILTNLAKGYDLEDACKEGKEYVTDFINSHNSLLGYHYV
ncbi:MAG TPA: bifunctional hydroxymethylpyrimidine kinase/phosphomethylpyrimidine kinase [Cytophagaceae bacterium]